MIAFLVEDELVVSEGICLVFFGLQEEKKVAFGLVLAPKTDIGLLRSDCIFSFFQIGVVSLLRLLQLLETLVNFQQIFLKGFALINQFADGA